MSRRDPLDADTSYPGWFYVVAPLVFVGAIVASIFWPWGWAL